MTFKNYTSKYKGKKRPDAWKYGPNKPEFHYAIIKYLRQRCQAKFRNEPWEFPMEEWMAVWNGRLSLRGRKTNALCMQRKDWNKPWCATNVEIVSRKEQLMKSKLHYHGKKT